MTLNILLRLGAHFHTTGTVGTEQDIDVAEIYRHEKYHSPQRYVFTQVSKWVPATYCWEVTPRWTGIPSMGE